MSALPAAFSEAVAAGFPADTLTTDPGDLAEYGRDWTRVFEPAPSAVAFPRTTGEVARLVRLCGDHGVAIVPSGGRTGLAGGAVAARGEMVVSLARMRRIDPVDLDGATVRVQAGAVTEAVHRHAAAHGLTWPIDLASKGSCTIGGNISTNAGGVKVIRYGPTRHWVLGVQAVLADGSVIECNGPLEKNNTGLDLRQLFIGSEGTLGIVTEATLKLTPLPARADVMLLAAADLAGVLALFRETRAHVPAPINAFEFFTDLCLARVVRHRPDRFARWARGVFARPSSHYVLIEVESGGQGTPPALEAWLASVLERGLAADAVVAQTPREAAELWSLRESIGESTSATGTPHKNDLALPLARLAAFCADLDARLGASHPGYEICIFGHIGDGNLHINVMKPDAMPAPEFHHRTVELDEALFTLVRAHGGSISAEHGIGLLKKPYLAFSHSPAELAAMRAVKRALDPRNLMNPGKIFDAT